MTLQDLLDRLGDRDVIVTSEEWAVHLISGVLIEGFEPTTKLAFLDAGIIGWLLPDATGREAPLPVRMTEIEGCGSWETNDEVQDRLAELIAKAWRETQGK
jgi:hypothetical protein